MDPTHPAPVRPEADQQVSEERARRASSFGTAAAAYAEHRPDYALAAIRWALEPIAGLTGPPRLLDLGAGTGKLTGQLTGLMMDRGRPEVIAVEPDPKMLGELRRQVPGVAAMEGSAEAIALPDASVDAVLAGQAAHWFDLDRALPEIARVLRPGGVFAGLWNADDDRVDWVAGLHEVSGRRTVTAELSARNSEQDDDGPLARWLRGSGERLFLPFTEAMFDHSQARTAASLVQTLGTHSMFLIMEPAERETVLGQVRGFLAETPQTASGEFGWPLVTLAMRAVRR
ncbi:MAG TPA: class I SAM-dependent methyltransferase [Streptosporangiaceae bacterium]|nr:class I SAM-dependent methyltransferase [Streptosporangiaceae bacterium]